MWTPCWTFKYRPSCIYSYTSTPTPYIPPTPPRHLLADIHTEPASDNLNFFLQLVALALYCLCALGGFNVSNLMGIKRRMIDIWKKITFYFLLNV
jgi:hypothetical protein